MDVKVTEKAKSRLHDMGVSDEVFLRIGVTSGGCSGNTYDAVLDDDMKEVMMFIMRRGLFVLFRTR